MPVRIKQFLKYQVYKTMTFEIEKSQTEIIDLLKERLKWTVTKLDDRMMISSTRGDFGRSHIDVFLRPISERKTEIVFKLHTLIHLFNYILIPGLFLLLIIKLLMLDSSDSSKVNSILFVIIIFAVCIVWLILLFHEYGSRFFTKRFIERLIKDISK